MAITSFVKPTEQELQSSPLEHSVTPATTMSPGYGYGEAVFVERKTIQIDNERTITPEEVEQELKEFFAARETIKNRIDDKIKRNTGEEESANLLSVRKAMLLDPLAEKRIVDLIKGENEFKKRYSSAAAISKALNEISEAFSQSSSSRLRNDIDGIKIELIRTLLSHGEHEELLSQFRNVSENSIIYTESVAANEIEAITDAWKAGNLKGIVVKNLSYTEHVSILLRGVGIPVVKIPPDEFDTIVDGQKLLISAPPGSSGALHHNVATDTAAILEVQYKQELEKVRTLPLPKDGPSLTKDGVEIGLLGTLDKQNELEKIAEKFSLGVGLTRTELLAADTNEKNEGIPFSYEKQLAIYRKMIRVFNGRMLAIRLYDFGGDKPMVGQELDGFFPERGAAHLLSLKEELLRPQIKAIGEALRLELRKNPELKTRLKVVIPVVHNGREAEEIKEVFEEELGEFGEERISLSIKIESTNAVLSLEDILPQTTSVFIGSSDLAQYVQRKDRTNSKDGGDINFTSVNFFKALAKITNERFKLATESNDIEFSLNGAEKAPEYEKITLCGGAVKDYLIPIHIGLGIRNFVPPTEEAERVNYVISQLDTHDCEELVSHIIGHNERLSDKHLERIHQLGESSAALSFQRNRLSKWKAVWEVEKENLASPSRRDEAASKIIRAFYEEKISDKESSLLLSA